MIFHSFLYVYQRVRVPAEIPWPRACAYTLQMIVHEEVNHDECQLPLVHDHCLRQRPISFDSLLTGVSKHQIIWPAASSRWDASSSVQAMNFGAVAFPYLDHLQWLAMWRGSVGVFHMAIFTMNWLATEWIIGKPIFWNLSCWMYWPLMSFCRDMTKFVFLPLKNLFARGRGMVLGSLWALPIGWGQKCTSNQRSSNKVNTCQLPPQKKCNI